MNQSNISLQSNIQPIKVNTSNYGPKYDVEFFAKIYDYEALNKLRFILSDDGSMNTKEYIFKPHQAAIVRSTAWDGFRRRDPSWGPVKNASGKIEMAHKPLETEEDIKYFDPSDESAATEYGYAQFLTCMEAHDLIINTDISGELEYGTPSYIPKEKTVVNLVKAAKKSTSVVDEPRQTETISESATEPIVDISDVFKLFTETTQEEIIEAPSQDIIFVDAGPGTGKTYTLIQRINHLVTTEGVNPENTLVLCFTNAAVDEIKARLKKFVDDGADRGLANVDVRTFHSFAWWLIGQANELFLDEGWQKVNMSDLNYDTSLKVASSIINKFHSTIVGNWEHFIVDEVQDLTNNLARFVLYIVNACLKNNCGFTVLGDACQAIYYYTEDYSNDSMKSEAFYRALTNQIRNKARFLKLIKNHRQNQTLIDTTHQLREAILSNEHEQMVSATKNMLEELPVFEKSAMSINLCDFDEHFKHGKVCLLLRNNGQTLRTSSVLRKRGIKHALNCNVTDRNFAPWIADVFYGYRKNYITFEDFQDLIAKAKSSEHTPSEIWNKLCKILHNTNDDLKVRDILDGIIYSKIDDEILRYHCDEKLIVSNIHRAKGREYECVILDQSFAESMTNEQAPSDEYKTLYVGVTRPKNHLYKSHLQKQSEFKHLPIYKTHRKRWGKSKNGRISHFEFSSNIDLNPADFVDVPIINFDEVRIDDEVCLIRNIHNGNVSYNIIHENTGNIVGKINHTYVDDMMHFMQLFGDKIYDMPDRISDLYISGIYTQIVDNDFLAADPDIAAITPNGVWKWVEIVGVGHMEYGQY